MGKNSRKNDGRGRSSGSRTTQFSSDRQPPRRSKQKLGPEPAELLHKAIYEKIPGLRNGKRVKILFIEVLIQSMRKKALEAKVGDQIKYFRELKALGVFDFEAYKKRLFRGMKNYYRELASSHAALTDLLEKVGAAYKRAQTLYLFYFSAFVIARNNCTCGACDRGLDNAERMMNLFQNAMASPAGDEADDDEEIDEEDSRSDRDTD